MSLVLKKKVENPLFFFSAKDEEIKDLEYSGATLTRKSLKTASFDPKILLSGLSRRQGKHYVL